MLSLQTCRLLCVAARNDAEFEFQASLGPVRARERTLPTAPQNMTATGQTLPSGSRSANDCSRRVSGSPSVGSRAAAERRLRSFAGPRLNPEVLPTYCGPSGVGH